MTSMKRNVIHGDFNTDVSKTMRCDVDVTVIDLILVSDADKIHRMFVFLLLMRHNYQNLESQILGLHLRGSN